VIEVVARDDREVALNTVELVTTVFVG